MVNDKKLKISIAQNRKSLKWVTEEIRWSEFVNKISNPIRTNETYEQFINMKKYQQDELKDVGGFVAGELKDGRRKAENILNRCLVTLDADNIENINKLTNIKRLLNGLGCSYALYTTRKHNTTKPRIRIIIPTDRTMMPEEYEPVARKIANFIGLEIMDTSTFEASRLMYWPSCSKDSNFESLFIDKPFASVNGILGMYKNWKDINEWPRLKSEPDLLKKEITKQKDPLEKENIIGVFCKTYNIHKAIEEFLSNTYEAGDKEDKYTYIEGSVANGATVYGDGKWLYSFHATDPASRTLCNSFDLVRIHKFGNLDDEIKEGTPANRYPSYIEMCKFVDSLPEIKELKQQRAIAEFEENPEKGLTDLYFENGQFQKEKFCKDLIVKEHIIRIGRKLFIYSGGIYINDDLLIFSKMITYIPNMPENKRNECLRYIDILITKYPEYDKTNQDNKNYIAFKNRII